ncbi:MAG: protein translocase subunit SecF, partial [Fimbriiglobus sp.]
YADDTRSTVTISPDPEWIALTEDAQRDDLMARAAALPGLSVEQVQLSSDKDLPSSTSKSFTVRTTEKEPDLVQVSLDRLLRDDAGRPLLEATKVTDKKVTGGVAVLTLDKPAAPGYLKSFVVRELKLANRVPLVGNASPVDVVGVPTEGDSPAAQAARQSEERSGRFTKLKVDVANNPEFRLLTDAGKAGADPARVAEEQASLGRLIESAVKSFEARPLPDRLETFDPALAADTRSKALYAILASWVAILGYLWFRFGSWTFGLAAVLCLIHDLCFTLGAIAVCHFLHDTFLGPLLGLQDFKIDLPAVAALLTLVGYSVNDTIVVFDRIKEVRGKSPLLTPQMINDSVNQTLSRTVLASLTVFLVVGVLYWFGGEGVHLFSFVMVVGVIVGTYSSIYIASPLLLILGEGTPKPTDRKTAPVAPVRTNEITA